MNKKFQTIISGKSSALKGRIYVPSDKSISHRALILGSLAVGKTIISDLLESEDVFSTIDCLKKLGVKIKKVSSKNYKIFGKGLGSLTIKKGEVLNFGNSGTLARLLIGILSTTPNIEVKVRGDRSLNRRSMKELIEILSDFGAEFLPFKR